MYPEGARSWYGESACEPAVFRLLEKPKVPILTAELHGNFEQQPRFSRRRALVRPMPARDAEQLVYLCPQCQVPFGLQGHDDGRLVCSACGSFVLLEGKGLSGPQGISRLLELEKGNLAWTQAYRPEGLRIVGRMVCWPGYWLRAGILGLEPEGLRVQEAQGPARRIAYGEITSVLVESNCKLELFYSSTGRDGYLFFLPPLRYAVFLQHFLRLRAFGNPYARYRGSGRAELPP